jgi:hypothetical protein
VRLALAPEGLDDDGAAGAGGALGRGEELGAALQAFDLEGRVQRRLVI